ncbi:LysR family transcriptional regulator [Terrarubrum flagellatum]|uniref:LysR family transcriptional regulator n=1 Tax=Terrirubrum flagellatum TaxID=2895980 RepID=UPI003144DCA0
MDLRQLRYFVAVAEERHITRAAERLGLQQPPLSQQIKTMEQELDVQLFRRKPRGVELTEAGSALFGEARALLAHMERALDVVRRTARGEQGRLNIGIAPTASFHPLAPKSIREFRARFPLASLTLQEGLSNEIAEWLSDERMDVAFVRNRSMRVDGVIVHPLAEEPMIAALPGNHPAARGRSGSLALKSLRDESFVLIGPPGTGLHDETIVACREAGFTPHIGQQAPRITSALGLVAAGLGVALVPQSMKTVKMTGVIYRPLSGPATPKAFLGLAAQKNNPSAVLRKFVASVRRMASA